MKRWGREVCIDTAGAREQSDDAVGMGHCDGELIESRYFRRSVLLTCVHLHDERGYRNLHAGDGDLVAVSQVIQFLEMLGIGVEVHGQRGHRRNTVHLGRILRSVP
jgi:hypothetical protein